MESFTHELVVVIRGSDLITARRSFGKNEALNGLIENLLEHDLEDSSTLPAIRDKIRMKLVSLDRIYNKCGRKWELFANKARIQAAFSQELRLNVDIPLGTYGNTNDGNTARKFFLNHEKSAEITGVDINVEELNNICRETGQLYIELYDWYKMPASLHKILIHGPIPVTHR